MKGYKFCSKKYLPPEISYINCVSIYLNLVKVTSMSEIMFSASLLYSKIAQNFLQLFLHPKKSFKLVLSAAELSAAKITIKLQQLPLS